MPTIIDLTPVSSRTHEEPPPRQVEEGRVGAAMARLKFRLKVMAFVLVTVAAVAGVLAIGLFIFLVLLGTAATLAAVIFVRRVITGRPAGTLQPRR